MCRALTASRRWTNECHCSPATGNASRQIPHATRIGAQSPNGRSRGALPASTAASTTSPTRRQVGVGLTSVPQRITP